MADEKLARYDAFLSYSKEDQPKALEIANPLKNEGLHVFCMSEIHPGDELARIHQARNQWFKMRCCHMVVPLL
jgi:hypothetical protein